jgi:hypothetical protein
VQEVAEELGPLHESEAVNQAKLACRAWTGYWCELEAACRRVAAANPDNEHLRKHAKASLVQKHVNNLNSFSNPSKPSVQANSNNLAVRGSLKYRQSRADEIVRLSLCIYTSLLQINASFLFFF